MTPRHRQRTVRSSLLAGLLGVIAAPLDVRLVAPLGAQRRPEIPVAPATGVGPVSNVATLSVLGLAARDVGDAGDAGNAADAVWMGVSQPLAHVGRVRLSAIGSGQLQARSAVGASSAGEGMLALRTLTRVGSAQAWTAASYGYARQQGDPSGGMLTPTPAMGRVAPDGLPTDTSISRRVDVGSVGRFESGLLTNSGPFAFAMGLSIERATRVSTQTMTIKVAEGYVAPSIDQGGAGRGTVRTFRAVQRREVATGLASMAFATGRTSWMLAVSAPLAAWVSGDEVGARPRVAPAVASVAVSQPVTGWFSLVGSASTAPTSVSTTALRSDFGAARRELQPVFAVGIRIARLPLRRGLDTPVGILGFETRLAGIDQARFTEGIAAADDTVRVELVIDAPRAGSVELMGDATEWTVTHLARLRDGRWRTELRLPPGVHRIAVRSDGGPWMAPPGLPTGNDDFGTPVGLIILRGR